MLPRQMTFTPENSGMFQNMPDDSGANVQVATSVKAGQTVAFNISGTGVLQAENSQAGGVPGSQAEAGNAAGRPGGGLGPPIDAPDPLHQYRWYLLGGFVLVLGIGAVLIVTRQGGQLTPAPASAAPPGNGTSRRSGPSPAAAAPSSDLLLEALKEEMFQLELEKQQGRISSDEYQKSKAALDKTLQRAVGRRKSG
jgi:hypothetical protein